MRYRLTQDIPAHDWRRGMVFTFNATNGLYENDDDGKVRQLDPKVLTDPTATEYFDLYTNGEEVDRDL